MKQLGEHQTSKDDEVQTGQYRRQPLVIADETAETAVCPRCQRSNLDVYWQEKKDGTRVIRGDCRRCHRFIKFLPEIKKYVALADRADRESSVDDVFTLAEQEGVQIGGGQGQVIVIPHWKGSKKLWALIKKHKYELLRLVPRRRRRGFLHDD